MIICYMFMLRPAALLAGEFLLSKQHERPRTYLRFGMISPASMAGEILATRQEYNHAVLARFFFQCDCIPLTEDF